MGVVGLQRRLRSDGIGGERRMSRPRGCALFFWPLRRAPASAKYLILPVRSCALVRLCACFGANWAVVAAAERCERMEEEEKRRSCHLIRKKRESLQEFQASKQSSRLPQKKILWDFASFALTLAGANQLTRTRTLEPAVHTRPTGTESSERLELDNLKTRHTSFPGKHSRCSYQFRQPPLLPLISPRGRVEI